MSAPVVYEGQVQGGGGTLFNDMKFWVAQRVPMRSTWVQNIENNGGTITKLDKQADYLIADHAKNDVPAGSYSWKWIEDSVKGGKIMDKEDYLIGAPRHESRPAGSVQHKSTRNSFTKQDDELLAKFVTRYEREGTAVLGNTIYKQFEAKYPHHTYQSWRDRWVKKLQYRERPHISDSKSSPPLADVPGAVSAKPRPMPQAPLQRLPAPRDTSARSASPPKKTRARFTQDEDQVLMQYIEDMKQYGKGVSGKNIYMDFAEDFPQHTWQAWRDRYLRQLRPREFLNDAEVTPQPSPAAKSAHTKTPQQPGPVQSNPNIVKGQGRNSGMHVPSAAALTHANPKQDDLCPEDLRLEPPSEDADRGYVAQNFIPPAEPGSIGDGTAEAAGNSISKRQTSHPDGKSTGSYGVDDDVSVSEMTTNQTQAFIDTREDFLSVYGNFLTAESQIDPDTIQTHITLHGRTFEIWSLWKVVQEQKVEPAERDWQQIAENLGFDWTEMPSIPDAIRDLYEINLAEFEIIMLEYGQDSGDTEEEDFDDEQTGTPQLQARKLLGTDGLLAEDQFNSSPPKQPSLKRAHDSTFSSDLGYPDSSRKRSRLDRAGEIPSTPDAKNGTLHLRPSVSAAISPDDRRYIALPKSSRAIQNKRSSTQVNAEDEEMQVRGVDEDAITRSRRAAIGPTMQGMQFETQVMGNLEEETQAEVTPSQQLHSEIHAEERRRELNRTSPTPKRKVKSPFIADDDDDDDNDEEEETILPKARFGKGPNPLSEQLHLLEPKRRSFHASFTKAMKAPSTQPRKSMPTSSQKSTWISSPRDSNRSTPAQLPARTKTKAEELAEVVIYWESLGYLHARRCLEAATWEPGLAGRVMEHMRDGNPIPTNWEGVWSPHDDESLRLIDSYEPPKDEREARKRRKAAERLKDKHGEERLELRRKWLAAKAEL
ncbi:Rap1 Myb domain-containing protein [Truncatella angustata]|uniref:DNA-binding protein RAP1 n=1 Tax=Truncatella angustata TaxID=152316 RepID=A0A9P8RPJ9_9PEZI|nr:Rap1 Myb domain-containing protein [Truncatella angustata]KAH6647838.1 Rap1 Myb domain-containing protein [Truncatella angustata]